ncbi:serine/threonine-protein kinase [Roseomonas marmotae]|uniref:Serine/threonine protein kinase n=1 Tax=Roseomonas marmotae TaxID=2768161 RepID=A0ABS3K893_9PROT|nr:serine/threonine-protein kinase [Roseomonas marmotae]MBO1073691.1 serine/threonine protein kinase [Roseomonas marmotae]QTI78667.1 serine/threonine protein kinase [Roseomonas marmotae]
MGEMPACIGRYQVRALLGRGGMGLVYRAHDPVIDRAVAIKLIHPALLGGQDGDAALALFRDEARAAGRCMHPHIVGLFDAAQHEGQPFLVMEYVEGEDLAGALRRAGGRLATGTAVAVAVQLLDALQAAHGQGVIHRDIKPSNVLLGRDGRARLSDFGIAHLASATDGPGTAGTPSYMSPEQCRGEAPDARSDLFSVGVLLQEMLSGERPFGSGTPSGIMQALLHAKPRALPPAGPDLPEALRAIIARVLSKSREARFASAAEMAAALRECPGLPPPAPLPAGGSDTEETRLAPVPAAGGRPGPTPLPQGTLRELQQVLTRYVGPIAGYLIREASLREKDGDAICASLARAIEGGDARDRFSREAGDLLAAAEPAPAAAWTLADLDQLRQALAQHLGPVAGLLVRRGAQQAPTLAALWEAMARHIEAPAERKAFLRRQPGASA